MDAGDALRALKNDSRVSKLFKIIKKIIKGNLSLFHGPQLRIGDVSTVGAAVCLVELFAPNVLFDFSLKIATTFLRADNGWW